jgi:Ca2+-binding EF-hand superfamily protein
MLHDALPCEYGYVSRCTSGASVQPFDEDKSGEVSLGDLKKCIQSIEDLVTSAEIKEMLKTCDADLNGSVSLEEFMAMMSLIADAPKQRTSRWQRR